MPLLPVVAGGLLLYGLWRLLRDYFVSSPLDNLPGPPPGSLIGGAYLPQPARPRLNENVARRAGNASELFNHDNWGFMRRLVDTYGAVVRVRFVLGKRWLYVYDPKALHSILVKDQELYSRGTAGNTASELILGPGLFSTVGARHRRQRKMLTPVFSSAHMRNMTPFFHAIVGKLRVAIESRVAAGEREVDVAGWMGRTALELIGQGGLGHSFDPLTEERSDAYTEAVKALVPSFVDVEWFRAVLPYTHYLGPAWVRRMLVSVFPHRGVQRLKGITDVMHKRGGAGDDALLHQVGEGKDVMSILRESPIAFGHVREDPPCGMNARKVKANMEADEEDKLPDEELIAQMSTFILAGVDTTSNALSRVLHLLCQHPEVQDKLRAELRDAHERLGTNIPYDDLVSLPYLDAVCRETLRSHPIVSISAREAHRDTIVPLSEPIRGVDGGTITEVAVPKGTFLILGLQACNTNKALWGEDAYEWKPERWLQPLPRAVEEARISGIYANLMTFGAGTYSCIGFKFSQLEMKVVLSTLVAAFRFQLPDKPITWNFAGVHYPTMGGPDKAKAEMYLKVTQVAD
ncbi:cytochrome P450 [Trametes elegans]|nr:cytochrome P450 [Trametes elegans]